MSVSLIGIISVQLYWINNAIESKDLQFNNDVKKSLVRASERLTTREEDQFYNLIQPILDEKGLLSKASISNFLIQQSDTISNSRYSFGTTIIDEEFKVPLDILKDNQFYDNDSIVVNRLTKKKDFFVGELTTGLDFKNNTLMVC